MNGNPKGLQILAHYSKLPIERINYQPEANESVIGSIDRGVLFLMAFWSGPSLSAFAKLTEVVGRLAQADDLELVVVDVDGAPALYEVPEFLGKVHGKGETAWIRNGRIVATSVLGLDTECYEPNTKLLLSLS